MAAIHGGSPARMSSFGRIDPAGGLRSGSPGPRLRRASPGLPYRRRGCGGSHDRSDDQSRAIKTEPTKDGGVTGVEMAPPLRQDDPILWGRSVNDRVLDTLAGFRAGHGENRRGCYRRRGKTTRSSASLRQVGTAAAGAIGPGREGRPTGRRVVDGRSGPPLLHGRPSCPSHTCTSGIIVRITPPRIRAVQQSPLLPGGAPVRAAGTHAVEVRRTGHRGPAPDRPVPWESGCRPAGRSSPRRQRWARHPPARRT